MHVAYADNMEKESNISIGPSSDSINTITFIVKYNNHLQRKMLLPMLTGDINTVKNT
jgi:hypothetical protein